jgi:putative DNA-invertase from lambdoid prophage Rac
MMNVYGYMRVSTNRQLDGESIGIQKNKITDYVMAEGLHGDLRFFQDDISGSVAVELRENGSKMIEGLKKGDVVIASKLDRLFRSSLDALQTLDCFSKKGVRLHLLDMGGDVSSGFGKLSFTMLAAFSEMERGRIAERITEAKAAGRQQGKHLGGKRRYGWDIVVDGAGQSWDVENETEQAILETIYGLRARGNSYRGIQSLIAAREGVDLSFKGIRNMCVRHFGS